MAVRSSPLDDAMTQVGDFGRYQLIIAALLTIPATFPCAFIGFSHVFISAMPEHWCAPPPELLPALQLHGGEKPEWVAQLVKNLTVPRVLKDGVMKFSQCEMYAVNYSALMREDPRWRGDVVSRGRGPNESWPRQSCQYLWEYDHSDYDETLLTKFNLVCDEDWWGSLCMSVFFVGSVVGSVIIGWITDKYGRRFAFFLVMVFCVVLPVVSAFAPNYVYYTVIRFFVGLTFPACYQTPFIIVMELTSATYRTGVGMIFGMVYGLAVSVLCLIAYLTREWFSLTLWSSLPFAVFFFYWWIIPESPRWLVQQNRLDEAEEVLQTIAKWNRRTVTTKLLRKLMMEENAMNIQEESDPKEYKSMSPIHLLKKPNTRKKTLLLMFIWLTNTLVYSGLSYMSANLGVSDYLAFAISGLVEAPSCLLAWYAMERWGRRWTTALAMILVGLCCLSNIFVPEEMTWLNVLLPTMGKFGITGTFSIVYIFGAELLPTVIRGNGLAVCAFICSLGLVANPYVIYLVVYMRVLPLVIMGFMSVLGGIAALFLPETFGTTLPDTLEEAELFGKDLKVLPECMRFSKINN